MEKMPSQNGVGVVPAKSLAEWLPELSTLLAEDMQASTRKNPRKTAAVAAISQTVETFRPLTIAEMRADIEALTGKTTKKSTATATKITASMKKRWNSSVKVDKRISHTSDGQMRNNPVRKVLNFQPKPPAQFQFPRNIETPKFPKPESRAKKSIYQTNKAKEPRISGVYKIPETPVEIKKPARSRLTLASKPNVPARVPIRESIAPKIPVPKYVAARKQFQSPKPPRKARVPDTPLSNDSWKSSCDASFLRNEKEIEREQVKEKTTAISEEATLENIAEVSPPVSTPFKEYRNVEQFFNNSSYMDATLVEDNTIMCFDKTVEKVDKIDDTLIVSLCDMFNKATVTHTDTENPRTELEILVEIRRETENNIKAQLRMLKFVNNLIQKKASDSEKNKPLSQVTVNNILVLSNENIQISPTPQRKTVIKSPNRSPSYKIPKRTPCLRKKVFHKSMPEMRDKTPEKVDGKALSMYMQMKEQMNFLNTPVVKQGRAAAPDTPALTSKNLQIQLNKLFGS